MIDGSGPGRESAASRAGRTLDTAQCLLVDIFTEEVVESLRAHGVRSILLKGPSFAAWLYRDGASRPYGDLDLLIAQEDVSLAHRVLVDLGFRYLHDSLPYFVRGTDQVDLHCSIKGVEAEDDLLWRTLSATTESQEVRGVEVEVLSEPARALHVALHAAQHGPDWTTQMEDLRRAVAQLPFETWAAASELAEQLGATAAFATGLRLLPEGEVVADRLRLTRQASVQTLLRAKSPPPLSLGFEELRGVSGFRGRVRFIARKLFPSRSYMRAMAPPDRRGPLDLVIAYFRRLVWLARYVIPGFRAWRQSRREADRVSRSG